MAVVETLLASGAKVTAWDNREEPRNLLAARVELADPLAIDLTGFSGVVVSPGVPLNRHPITDHAASAGVPVIGDIELFAEARVDLPPHRVVGITGTNGKSTTTALVHHLLHSAGIPARMGGNIGLPILSQKPLAPNDLGDGVYVLELSSYQIDLTRTLACDVAALLNISPDHLDRYDSFAAYAASKQRLFAMQRPDQHAVFGMGDAETAGIATHELARRAVQYVHVVTGADLVAMQPDWPSLQGPHNLQNAAAAVAIVTALGLTEAQWGPALRTFSGWSASPKSTACCSSTTARQPIPPRRPRRWRRSRRYSVPMVRRNASTGSSAACPRATTSTNARPSSAMSLPPIPSAMRGHAFPRYSIPTCRSAAAR
jgi:UDP-N-acetylmuramoylalanine--D-glutamate ligase